MSGQHVKRVTRRVRDTERASSGDQVTPISAVVRPAKGRRQRRQVDRQGDHANKNAERPTPLEKRRS